MIASAALLLGTFACKKNETTPHPQPQGLEASAPTNEVKQKMYDLSPELITVAVRNFKGHNTSLHSSNQNINQRVTSVDVHADSSIWILEAALNFNFDKIPSGSETSCDSASYEINYVNNNVTAADLTNTYNYFNQYISQKTSGTDKVKVIDITAYFNNTKITYVANITLFPDLAQKTTGLCDPYRSTYTANWSNSWMTTYSCYSGGNDGPNSCAAKLNCNIAIGSCPGFYWANVVTVKLGDFGNVWTGLYYSPNKPTVCSEPLMYGSDINNRVTLSQGYAASNLPSSPSGMHIASYGVFGRVMPGSVPYTHTMWWGLNLTYGTYACGSTPD